MTETVSEDYRDRSYLSAIEAARYLGVSVNALHNLVSGQVIKARVATSGQMRFTLASLKRYEVAFPAPLREAGSAVAEINNVEINGTHQRVFVKNAQKMDNLPDNSVHLMITSPPYFNTKMYAKEPVAGDLGNIHDVDEWFASINEVWGEVFRVLQPGRKAFINIMNLPIRLEGGSFRALNLMGRTIDTCEEIGFIFKRDIIWQKTNSVRAHFGTYPYPGGILINNMHEFILEFAKPARKGFKKYQHLTPEQKEQSKLDKEFWLSLKKSDVWLMKPQGSKDRRNHVVPFPYEFPRRLIKAYSDIWLMKPQGSGDRRNHVAPFPYELPYRLIKAYSYVGEAVLDPFLGSGATLLAAAGGYGLGPAEIGRRASIYRDPGPNVNFNDAIVQGILNSLDAAGKVERRKQANGRGGWRLTEPEYNRRRDDVQSSK